MRTMILLDIDGTLVDTEYKVNSDSIFGTIKALEDKGIIFSLNSNRALEDLLPAYKKFGLNGFIIGENGAFSVVPNQQPSRYVKDGEITVLLERIPKLLKSRFPGSEFLAKDTVAFLQKPEKNDAKILFVSNKFRKYTMSIFVGRVEKGIFVRDLKLLKQASELVAAEIKALGAEFDVVTSLTSGNLLINPKSCSKATTLKKIVDEQYEGYEVVMISDDENSGMIGSVDRFYTISNANERVKAAAVCVSEYDHAKGVEDILRNVVLDKARSYIKRHSTYQSMTSEPAVVRLTKELIDINTANPPGREIEAARYIRSYLKGLGIGSQIIEFEPGRANVVASIGKGDGLMLNGHIDTVPFPTGKQNNSAVVKGGRIYGRGAADMKGAVASILASLEGIDIDNFGRRLLLAFVADEESKFKGSQYLLSKRKSLFNGVRYGIIAEPSGLKIRLGQKGILGVKIGFRGKMAHGSSPWLGDNAIAKAASFVQDIERLREAREIDEKAQKGTIAITRMNGGVAGNVIPDYCEVHVDRRIAPNSNTAAAFAQIKKIAKRHDRNAAVEIKVAREPYRINPNSRLVKWLKEMTGAQTYYARTYTEAELYGRVAGIECVVYGPGESRWSHDPNESVSIANLQKATKTYVSVIEKWCL